MKAISILFYMFLFYLAITLFFWNFNTFTLAEKLTVILIVSGMNILSFINTRES